ncbi:MAG: M20/M25/M40 family metallo-hydrolase, partial [Gammaproteobacteria bacterium]|nr:M20/M25/M40 family metallo-hydrolase [Gammaproteobacteria bacterium]
MRALALTLLILALSAAAAGSAAASEYADAADYAAAAPGRLAEFIQVNTQNPPGNETRGADYLAGIFAAAGIEYETAESAPGRGNIWARLAGGDKPPLILLNHMDVVPADPRYWSFDPFSGAIRDGYVYGRGALDMKGLGIVQLQAFLALHAAGRKPDRDIVFVATADEEAGGAFGAGWLVEHHPEIFANAGYLINEGGGGTLLGDNTVFSVELTQKVPLWLRL